MLRTIFLANEWADYLGWIRTQHAHQLHKVQQETLGDLLQMKSAVEGPIRVRPVGDVALVRLWDYGIKLFDALFFKGWNWVHDLLWP